MEHVWRLYVFLWPITVLLLLTPGAVAWSDARPLGVWTVGIWTVGRVSHVRQHYFVEIGYEIISKAILSLPLIYKGLLSVTGERVCTTY